MNTHIFEAIKLLLITSIYADDDIISWDKAVKTGIFKQQIKIDYKTKIWDNKAPYVPALSIFKKFSKRAAKSTIIYGWDRTVVKDILTIPGETTSNTSTGTLDIELTAGDKNNLLVNQNLQLCYTPGSGYTNDVYVVSKDVSGHVNQITVAAIDPTLKIGVGSGTPIPANTMINCLGTYFEEYSGSVKPISQYPRKVTNYMQFFKSPYEYSETAANVDLYTDGTLRNELDKQAQIHLMIQMEKAILMNGKKYGHDATTSDETQNSKMQGILYSIFHGDDYGNVSPANHGYSGDFSIDEFDAFQFPLFDSELGDVFGKRFVLCNKAARKFFTDLKTAKPAVELAPNDTYGIKGITKVITDAGELDVFVHPKIDKRFPDMDKPFMAALTLPMIEIEELIPTYLAANIQATDVTGYKSEYRNQSSVIVNQVGSPYFGMLYDSTKFTF